MKIQDLVETWEKEAENHRTSRELKLRLPIALAAKLQALCELFPGQTQDKILGDLLSAALSELETSFVYRQGETVVAEDEMGDPIYADVGLTPQYHELTKKYLRT